MIRQIYQNIRKLLGVSMEMKNIVPIYDINKIKFVTDKATFKRAVGLYESGNVMLPLQN